MKIGSGTLGLFSATNNQDFGARAIGSTGNFFDPLAVLLRSPSPATGSPVWGIRRGDHPLSAAYKSNPNDALINGLYTTASFGVTSFKTGPAGLPGLTNFTGGNGMMPRGEATAGVGVQITPQISIEGSVGFTQMPPSAFR